MKLGYSESENFKPGYTFFCYFSLFPEQTSFCQTTSQARMNVVRYEQYANAITTSGTPSKVSLCKTRAQNANSLYRSTSIVVSRLRGVVLFPFKCKSSASTNARCSNNVQNTIALLKPATRQQDVPVAIAKLIYERRAANDSKLCDTAHLMGANLSWRNRNTQPDYQVWY